MLPAARLVVFSVLSVVLAGPLVTLILASRLPPWAAWLGGAALPLLAYALLVRRVLTWWIGRGAEEALDQATSSPFSAERLWVFLLPDRPSTLIGNLNALAVWRVHHPEGTMEAVFLQGRAFTPTEDRRLALLVEQYRSTFDGTESSSLVGWVTSPSSPLQLRGAVIPLPGMLEVHLVAGWSDDPDDGHARALGFGLLRLPARQGASLRSLSKPEARELTLKGPGFDGLDPEEVVVGFFPPDP